MAVPDISPDVVCKTQVLRSFQVKNLNSNPKMTRALDTIPAFLGISHLLWHIFVKNNEVPSIKIFGYSGSFVHFLLLCNYLTVNQARAAHLQCLPNASLIDDNTGVSTTLY